MLDKITMFDHLVLDGHCPALGGKQLNAYVTAGIESEHECTTVEEALEKLRAGLTIFIREGTATRNLLPLLPMVTAENHAHICFCTDDRIPASLLDDGSIDMMIRTAIDFGIDPMMAIRMGTLNTARYFGLRDHGAIAPGRRADMVVFSDLQNIQAEMVFRGGELVAQDGEMLVDTTPKRSITLRSTMNIKADSIDFRIPANGEKVRVIGHIRDQIVTEHLVESPKVEHGQIVADTERDILKMVVIERHKASGNVGKGLIHGFGLKRGCNCWHGGA